MRGTSGAAWTDHVGSWHSSTVRGAATIPSVYRGTFTVVAAASRRAHDSHQTPTTTNVLARELNVRPQHRHAVPEIAVGFAVTDLRDRSRPNLKIGVLVRSGR
jgi:hypothetical protein